MFNRSKVSDVQVLEEAAPQMNFGLFDSEVRNNEAVSLKQVFGNMIISEFMKKLNNLEAQNRDLKQRLDTQVVAPVRRTFEVPATFSVEDPQISQRRKRGILPID